MTFLITLALALLGVGVAVAAVRAGLTSGSVSWGRTTAVAAVALIGATGLANAAHSFRTLKDRRAQWSYVAPADALDHNSSGAGVDPLFVKFAKGFLLRGETFFISRNAGNETRLWLNYRLAPNLAEDKLEDAHWLIYWQEPDPFKTHGVRVEDIIAHQKWGPDVGLIRIRRPTDPPAP